MAFSTAMGYFIEDRIVSDLIQLIHALSCHKGALHILAPAICLRLVESFQSSVLVNLRNPRLPYFGLVRMQNKKRP